MLKAGYEGFGLGAVSFLGRLLICRCAGRWRCLVYEEDNLLYSWNETALRNVGMAIKRGRKMGKVGGVVLSVKKSIEERLDLRLS